MSGSFQVNSSDLWEQLGWVTVSCLLMMLLGKADRICSGSLAGALFLKLLKQVVVKHSMTLQQLQSRVSIQTPSNLTTKNYMITAFSKPSLFGTQDKLKMVPKKKLKIRIGATQRPLVLHT